MNPNWAHMRHPVTKQAATTPLQGMGFLLVQMSATDNRLKVDQLSAQAWLDAVAQFEPGLVVKAFAAHYANQDLARFTIRPDQARAWAINALPPRPRCPEHPSYYLGPGCGGCRGERIERGEEKMIGQSTVPKLSGKAVPKPANWAQLLKGIPE